MLAAEWILGLTGLYLACGLAFGACFVTRGVERIDRATHGTSPLFRLLILPGTALLWPLLAIEWWRAGRPGDSP